MIGKIKPGLRNRDAKPVETPIVIRSICQEIMKSGIGTPTALEISKPPTSRKTSPTIGPLFWLHCLLRILLSCLSLYAMVLIFNKSRGNGQLGQA